MAENLSQSMGSQLLDLACRVEQLEAENATLRGQVERLTELGRKFYRRGYLAGRAAQRRGAKHVPDPASIARKEPASLVGMRCVNDVSAEWGLGQGVDSVRRRLYHPATPDRGLMEATDS